MDLSALMDSKYFTYLILPLLIFTARVLDVTLGTIRIVFVSRGKKFLAPVFGFFEVLIWLLAIGQIMKNLTNVDGQGATGKVNLVFMVIKRTELRAVTGIIRKYHPQAFYSVEDVRQVSRGVFPDR